MVFLDAILYHQDFIYLLKRIINGIFDFLFLTQLNINTPILSITWYISATIIATFILYPLLRSRFSNVYCCIISPLILALYLSVAAKVNQNITVGNNTWYGIFYGGTFRAIAELGWGCFLFANFATLRPKHQRLLPFIEIICYLEVFISAFFWNNTSLDFISFVSLTIAIPITLSGNGVQYPFSEKHIRFMGDFSYALYMSHRRIINLVKIKFPVSAYPVRMALVIVLSAFVALVIMYIGNHYRKKRSAIDSTKKSC